MGDVAIIVTSVRVACPSACYPYSVRNYAILFQIMEDTVQIERVVYVCRDLPGIFGP